MTSSHEALISDWIDATNSHDTGRYLSFFADDAVLTDPGVGGDHPGHARIREYFESWFVALNTQTQLIAISPRGDLFHVEVHFVGDFPGGEVDGIFDIAFDGERFAHVTADLV